MSENCLLGNEQQYDKGDEIRVEESERVGGWDGRGTSLRREGCVWGEVYSTKVV